MSTIPASQLVNITPNVLGAGGAAIDLSGLILTDSTRAPINNALEFPSAPAVASYFGAASKEARLGGIYFAGFDNSNVKPGKLFFAQYNAIPVAAYLRGGKISDMTLAQLQALSGSLTVILDGYTHTAASISLAAATSFSNAASIIQTALFATDPVPATFTASIGATSTSGTGSGTNLTVGGTTVGLISVGDVVAGVGVPVGTTIVSQTSGTPGGNGVYVTSVATTAAGVAVTFTSTVLNVSAVSAGALAAGQTVVGAGVGAGTLITSQLTGLAGAVGTYRISAAYQIASEAMTGVATDGTVTYDSTAGAFKITSGVTGAPSTAAYATGTLAAPLLLTLVTGAVLSQGAVAQTPAAYMTHFISAVTQNWAAFMTMFDPDSSGNTNKQAFSDWTSLQNQRYAYAAWDTDASPTVTVPANASLGQLLKASGATGTIPLWQPSGLGDADSDFAAFVLGSIASIDFTELNGRTTLAFRSQAGLVATVTDETVAQNLIANGYNYYGAYGAANQEFVFLVPGSIVGSFLWIDSYVNQIWLNNFFQISLLNLLANAKSIPYNQAGYGMIQATLADPINAALFFGAIRQGITLSASQVAAVNAAAGRAIDRTLSTQGWYLQVLDAAPSVRPLRGSPPITFWYMDGESIQKIEMASIAVQ